MALSGFNILIIPVISSLDSFLSAADLPTHTPEDTLTPVQGPVTHLRGVLTHPELDILELSPQAIPPHLDIPPVRF